MCAICMQHVLCVCQVGGGVSWYELSIMQKNLHEIDYVHIYSRVRVHMVLHRAIPQE